MPPILPLRKSHAVVRKPFGRTRRQAQHQERRVQITDIRREARNIVRNLIPESLGPLQRATGVATRVSSVAAVTNIAMAANDARQMLLRRTCASFQQQHREHLPQQPEQQPQNTHSQPAPQSLTSHGPQQQSEPQTMPVQECPEQPHHEASSCERDNVQHSSGPAQDGPHESFELGWTIFEDPTDQEPLRATESQPTMTFEKVNQAFSDNKVKSRKKDLSGLRRKKDSDNASDKSLDKENAPPGWQQESDDEDDQERQSQSRGSSVELDSLEWGSGGRTGAPSSDGSPQSPVAHASSAISSPVLIAGGTWKLLLEILQRERMVELERQDLVQRIEAYKLHRAQLKSLRDQLQVAVMEERQSQAQDMSRKRRRQEDEADDAKVARARIDSQQGGDHPAASTSSSQHRSRQARATSRPRHRRALARTSLEPRHHSRDRVHALGSSQHYGQPQEDLDAQALGEVGESPSSPIEFADEAPEEAPHDEDDVYADEQDSFVVATSSSQLRPQHQHTQHQQARRLQECRARQQDQAESQHSQEHPESPQQSPQQSLQQTPQQQRELIAREDEEDEMSMTDYLSLYSNCAEYYRYGEVYRDGTYEFRNVTLPKAMLSRIQPDFKLDPNSHHDHTLRLLNEAEWRFLGVRMSRGWVNYTRHDPEPHILMFRRTHDAANQVSLAAATRMEEKRRLVEEGAAIFERMAEEVEEEEMVAILKGMLEAAEEAEEEEGEEEEEE